MRDLLERKGGGWGSMPQGPFPSPSPPPPEVFPPLWGLESLGAGDGKGEGIFSPPAEWGLGGTSVGGRVFGTGRSGRGVWIVFCPKCSVPAPGPPCLYLKEPLFA